MYLIIYFTDEKTKITYYVSDFYWRFNQPFIKLDNNPDNACYILAKNLEKILLCLPSAYPAIVVDCEAWLLLKKSMVN